MFPAGLEEAGRNSLFIYSDVSEPQFGEHLSSVMRRDAFLMRLKCVRDAPALTGG